MSDRHPAKERMIEALYGELDAAAKERHDLHLRSCPACASEQAALAETLRTMDERERPDPGPEFWAGYWDRLSRRMVWEAAGEDRSPSLIERLVRPLARLPRWSLQAAGAAVLLAVGVLVGSRLVPPPGGDRVVSAAAAPPSAVVKAESFVERSQILLLGLVNHEPSTEDAYALDLDHKKAVSRGLAAEAPALRAALSEGGEKRLRALVADLEVILLQIANLESGQDLEAVELIKQGVDSKGILLKIDLARMGREARARTAPAAAAPGPKKSKA
jgi:hypothetical protein